MFDGRWLIEHDLWPFVREQKKAFSGLNFSLLGMSRCRTWLCTLSCWASIGTRATMSSARSWSTSRPSTWAPATINRFSWPGKSRRGVSSSRLRAEAKFSCRFATNRRPTGSRPSYSRPGTCPRWTSRAFPVRLKRNYKARESRNLLFTTQILTSRSTCFTTTSASRRRRLTWRNGRWIRSSTSPSCSTCRESTPKKASRTSVSSSSYSTGIGSLKMRFVFFSPTGHFLLRVRPLRKTKRLNNLIFANFFPSSPFREKFETWNCSEKRFFESETFFLSDNGIVIASNLHFLRRSKPKTFCHFDPIIRENFLKRKIV